MIKKSDLVQIGKFVKPHGIKGEVSLATDFDLEDMAKTACVICDMEGILTPFFIESLREKSNTLTLVKFDGIEDKNEAGLFAGKAAFVNKSVASENFREAQQTFAGYKVVDAVKGEIGVVDAVDETTANKLLLVGERMIPVALVTNVNREEKTLETALPEGFLEI